MRFAACENETSQVAPAGRQLTERRVERRPPARGMLGSGEITVVDYVPPAQGSEPDAEGPVVEGGLRAQQRSDLRSIGREDDAAGAWSAVHQRQPVRGAVIGKQAYAPSKEDRVNQEAVLIDQVVRQQ